MKLVWLFLSVVVSAFAGEAAVAQTLPRALPDNWVISETSSPVDYTPVVVAVARSLAISEDALLELSIICRNGRTNFVMTGTAISGHSNDYRVSYRLQADPVELDVRSAAVGLGVAIQGDVVRLLQSLPGEGRVTIRLAFRGGVVREISFLLDGLNAVRTKMARACNWPKPGNK
jgi:hypothetical protein